MQDYDRVDGSRARETRLIRRPGYQSIKRLIICSDGKNISKPGPYRIESFAYALKKRAADE